MKNIRLEFNANETRLVYSNGFITEYSPVIKPVNHQYDASSFMRRSLGLAYAYKTLRENIQTARSNLRDADKLASKRDNAVLTLLREKRICYASTCFDSKKPVNLTKHVGVEIEFVCGANRKTIANDLAMLGIAEYVQLKSDASVKGESSGDNDCDGSCREDCDCADCGETHYCDGESECNTRTRTYGSFDGDTGWTFNDDCSECTDTETIDECDCGGIDDDGKALCKGEHIVCQGHCPGHNCIGYEDHENYECNCECNCGGGDDCGHEIAVVAKSTKITDVINKVCQVLQKHDAEINGTCGLHVHIDMRGFDEKRCFANLVKAQKLLYSMVPNSRYENSYCQPSQDLDMSAYNGRYWGINPQSFEEHQTIEVRLHSGTVNAVKINNWIRLLQKIAYAKSVKKLEKLSDLTNTVKLSAPLHAYVRERIAKFKSEYPKQFFIDDTQVLDQLDLIAA